MRNEEGLVFCIPEDDVVWVGEHDTARKVNKTQMMEAVLRHRGFVWLEFKKVSTGELRQFFGLITGIRGSDVFLRDAEKHQEKSDDNVMRIVTQRTLLYR